MRKIVFITPNRVNSFFLAISISLKFILKSIPFKLTISKTVVEASLFNIEVSYAATELKKEIKQAL